MVMHERSVDSQPSCGNPDHLMRSDCIQKLIPEQCRIIGVGMLSCKMLGCELLLGCLHFPVPLGRRMLLYHHGDPLGGSLQLVLFLVAIGAS